MTKIVWLLDLHVPIESVAISINVLSSCPTHGKQQQSFWALPIAFFFQICRHVFQDVFSHCNTIAGELEKALCDKVCQWNVTGW